MNLTQKVKYATASAFVVTVCSIGTVVSHAVAGGKPGPTPKCNISPVQAIKIAIKKVHGRALNANFELAEGKWVYGVMVVTGKTIQEVEIDPMTGKIGDVEKITPEGEAKELQGELNAAIGVKSPAPEADEKDEKPEKP